MGIGYQRRHTKPKRCRKGCEELKCIRDGTVQGSDMNDKEQGVRGLGKDMAFCRERKRGEQKFGASSCKMGLV